LFFLLFGPVDGVVSEVYGLWSGKRLLAFLIGFLSPLVALAVPIMRLGWHQGFGWFVFLALGMGLMGFGGAKYRVDKERKWLVIGFLAWLFFLYMMFWTGLD